MKNKNSSELETNIPIVFSCDDNYAPYLGVALKSLIENSSQNKNYQIFILDGGIKDVHKSMFLELNQKNICIKFLDMDSYINEYKNYFFTRAHFSISAYFRLFLPKIFSDLDKILYLDCDIIILDDVSKLYNENIYNDYLGAIRDYVVIRDYNTNYEFKNYIDNILKIKEVKEYFNSGILLMNLSKMREDNIFEKLILKLKQVETPLFVDQCILNSVCQGHVKYLDLKYNFTWIFFFNQKCYNSFPSYILNIVNKAEKDIKIIHYITHLKPWNMPSLKYAEHWWKYARMTPFYEEILFKNLKSDPVQNITQQINQVFDAQIVRDIAKYSKTRFNYYRCKLLSKITFGKMRKHYKRKRKELKAKLKTVRKFLRAQ